MSMIYDENRYYGEKLFGKYMQQSGANAFVGAIELICLKAHGKVSVGYLDDYLPFCSSDPQTGELKGALRKYLDLASGCFKNTEISFETKAYPTTEAAMKALENGEVDCVFPVNLNAYDSNQRGVLTTGEVMETEMFAAVKRQKHPELSVENNLVVALMQGDVDDEEFVKEYFPNWTIKRFISTAECYRAVSIDKADCTLLNNYQIEHMEPLRAEYDLAFITTGEAMSVCFAVARDDVQLYSILNKTTGLVDMTEVNTALVTYSYSETDISIWDYLKKHPAVIIVISLLMVVVIWLILMLRNRRIKRELEERLKLEEALSDALEQAEKANAAKTTFLSSMSHEIRTPMNAIIGLNDLAMREPDLSEKMQDYLKKMDGSARHLLGLINDILDMSRIESGSMTIKDENFSFSDMLDQINTMIDGQCRAKGLSYSFHKEGELDGFYIGDEMKLKQVLINILGNAVKYTPSPGTVSFTVSEQNRFKDNATMTFEIKDSGIGMDSEFIPKIFNAFSQEDEKKANTYGSTGLGMAITKNIVDMMNGRIDVESEKDVGTTFYVTVTLKISDRNNQKPNTSEENKDEQKTTDLTGKRIIVAEDMDINAEILINLLGVRGIIAERANDGQMAVDKFRDSEEYAYDAILMDIRMPVLDGLAATEEIRSMNRRDANSIPIIAMTANAFNDDVERSLNAGMNAHLSKPIDPEKLFETLERLV